MKLKKLILSSSLFMIPLISYSCNNVSADYIIDFYILVPEFSLSSVELDDLQEKIEEGVSYANLFNLIEIEFGKGTKRNISNAGMEIKFIGKPNLVEISSSQYALTGEITSSSQTRKIDSVINIT